MGSVNFPEDTSGRRRHLSERLDRPFRTVLLDEPEKDGEHDDDPNDDGLDGITHHRRKADCDEQDDDQDVPELGCEQRPRRREVSRTRTHSAAVRT